MRFVNHKYWIIGILIIVSIGGAVFLLFFTEESNVKNELTIINSEVGLPDSFDPLNADKTQNISAMRLLYSTPLAINYKNELVSHILSKFSYDSDKHRTDFFLKEGLFYEDGQPINALDLALSIARFGYFNPNFPVIKNIKGLNRWANEKAGLKTLPPGILVNNNKVTILFAGYVSQPLFRFCLEIFSIIPASSIDLKTGKLKVEKPPSSGPFLLTERKAEEWIFKLSPQFKLSADDPSNYSTIKIKIGSIESICSRKLEFNEIATGFEMEYLLKGCVESHNADTYWLPASRFGLLRFNPNVTPFQSAQVRSAFAEAVRSKLKMTNPDLEVERGLFTKLLPGYLPFDKFEISPIEVDKLRDQVLNLPKSTTAASWQIYKAIGEVAENLGMRVKFQEKNWSADDLVDSFIEGKFSVIYGGSGFWAQDPIGDLSMYFTKNFHKTMTFTWKDEGIYQRLEKISSLVDPAEIKFGMEDFNRYITKQSIISPIIHFRRFYITSPSQKLDELPQAVTSPAPWQLHLIDL